MTPIIKIWRGSWYVQNICLYSLQLFLDTFLPKISFSLSRLPRPQGLELESGRKGGTSWQKLGGSGHLHCMNKMSSLKANLYLFWVSIVLRKVCWLMVMVGGTVKIASATGPDPLILNWYRFEWLRMELKCTSNGPGMDLDWIWTGAWQKVLQIWKLWSNSFVYISVFRNSI